ncbi:HCMV_UL139 domain-containing protein, partial [Cephalotus follicularis]
MALTSAFSERLQEMEHTRNQRLSILQTERELQASRSQILESKLDNIRSIEQICLLLRQKIASSNFNISALKSQIDTHYANHQAHLQQFRDLKNEVEELEELEKEKEKHYEVNELQMKQFKENVEEFTSGYRMRVQELRSRINKLKSIFAQHQGNNGYMSNAEIAAAEIRKSELLAVKGNLDRTLACNYQIRENLQKQLQKTAITQNQDR